MEPPSAPDVTQLLQRAGKGDENAVADLYSKVYEDLRKLAASYLRRERAGHTLQPTALVNESYFRLVDRQRAGYADRGHFFAVAAQAMRRILVEHARKRGAKKRGGKAGKVSLDALPDQPGERDQYLLLLDGALEELAEVSERQARVVELRFFGGLSIADTAEVMDVSHATIERDWAVARAWLHRQLSQDPPDEG